MSTDATVWSVPRLIGMVHVGALPGTPRSACAVTTLARHAADEAAMLADAGFDAIMLENMHDAPYLRRTVGPEIVAAMAAVATTVRARVDLPLGVQILAGANRAALAVAHAAGGAFIRAEGFSYAAVADEGLLDEADAGPLLRARRAIGADDIRILADIKKKHSSHALTADIDLAEHVQTAAFLGADAVIVSGSATGTATAINDLREVIAAARRVTDVAGRQGMPVLAGSGATPESVGSLFEVGVDAVVVGSSIKVGEHWRGPIDPDRAAAFVAAAR